MARSEGSLCSKESKSFSEEIALLSDLPYKQNLDYLRLIEELIVYRIAEQVRESKCEDNQNPAVVIEIPLIGNLTIKPVIFHKSHRLTDKPSIHFEYTFKPLSGFKKHVLEVYTTGECELPTKFAKQYGQKLVSLYKEGE